jgi:hypothetical protein
MGFFIAIGCPWLVLAVLDKMATSRREQEFAALGVTAPAAPERSAYLTPDVD